MKAKWAGFLVLLLGAGLLSKAQAGTDAVSSRPNPMTAAVLDAFQVLAPQDLSAPSLQRLNGLLTKGRIAPTDELPAAFGPLITQLGSTAIERGEDIDALVKEPSRLIANGQGFAAACRALEAQAKEEAQAKVKALNQAVKDFHAAYDDDPNADAAAVRRLSGQTAELAMNYFPYLANVDWEALRAAHKNAEDVLKLAGEAREQAAEAEADAYAKRLGIGEYAGYAEKAIGERAKKQKPAAAPKAAQAAGSGMIEAEPEHFVAAPPPDVRKEMEDYIPYMLRLEAAAKAYKLLKDRGEKARFWRASEDIKQAREFWKIADQAFGRLERRLKAELKGIEKVGPGPASREKLKRLNAEVIALYNWVNKFASYKDYQVPEGQKSRYAFKATIMDTDARNNGSRFNPQTGEMIVHYVTKQYMGDEGAKTMLEKLITDAGERIGKRDKRERDKVAPYASALRAWEKGQIKDRKVIVPIIKLAAYQEARLERAQRSADRGYFQEVAQTIRTGSDGLISRAALTSATRQLNAAVEASLQMAAFLWFMAMCLWMPATALAVRLAGYSAPAALAVFSVLAVLAVRAFVRLERWRGAYRRLVTLDRLDRLK